MMIDYYYRPIMSSVTFFDNNLSSYVIYDFKLKVADLGWGKGLGDFGTGV